MTQKPLYGYQHNQVTHISLEKLLVLLYEGAIAFLRQAQESLRKHDQITGGIKLLRARDIVSSLRNGLDFEQGGELALNLDRLYSYVHDEIIRTSKTGEPALLEPLIDILSTLKEGWQEVSQKAAANESSTPPTALSPTAASAQTPTAYPQHESRRLSVTV